MKMCIWIPKWCVIVEVEVGVACSGGAGGLYCVEGVLERQCPDVESLLVNYL